MKNEKTWYSVVFLSGDDAREVFKTIEETDNGYTPNHFEKELFETLQEWDNGDFGFEYASSPAGRDDTVYTVKAGDGEKYEVSYNLNLEYCGLCLIGEKI